MKRKQVAPRFDPQAEEPCWAEWFAGCTIAKCKPQATEMLVGKGQTYFRHWLNAYDATVTCADLLSPRERPWRIFETDALAKRRKKTYKDWLREYRSRGNHTFTVEERVAALNSGIKVLFRTVVRQRIVDEDGRDRRDPQGHKRGRIVEPPPGDDGERSWDWGKFPSTEWPRPDEETAQNETLAMVQTCLPALLGLMTKTVRVAMAAKLTGVSLANKGLKPFAGVEKSQIDSRLKALDEKLRVIFAKRYPNEVKKQVLCMQVIAIQFLMSDSSEWLKKPENGKLLRFLQKEGKKYETF